MDAYPNKGQRRILRSEIEEIAAEKTGGTVVIGFEEIDRLGDAVVGGERIAGFMETGDRREWYLPLSAKKSFSWKTAPVPQSPRDRVSFVLSLGFGNGSPLPQPSGQWDLYCNGRFALSVRVVKHSQFWRGGGVHACLLGASDRVRRAVRGSLFEFGPAGREFRGVRSCFVDSAIHVDREWKTRDDPA